MLFILFKVKIYSELKWIWWLNRVGLIYIRFTTETQLNLAFNLVLELIDAFINFLQSCNPQILLTADDHHFSQICQHGAAFSACPDWLRSLSFTIPTDEKSAWLDAVLQSVCCRWEVSSPALPISVWSRDTWDSHDQSAAVQCSSVLGQWYVGGGQARPDWAWREHGVVVFFAA